MLIIKLIFSFSGRFNRARYWGYSFLLLIPYFFARLFISTESLTLNILALIISVAVGVSGISISVRRLHDLDKSGWMILLSFIPIANIILGIYMMFFPGTDGPNYYGADPITYPPYETM